MSDKIDTKRSLNCRSEATELLDIYTQFKKIQLKKYMTPKNRSSLRKSQKLLRLIESKHNQKESKEIEVTDEKKKNISVHNQQKPARARIIKLEWDPEEDEQHKEDNITPSKTSDQPILKASGRDRRKLEII